MFIHSFLYCRRDFKWLQKETKQDRKHEKTQKKNMKMGI